MTDKTVAKIGEAMFEIERREDLYNWQIGDIYVWSVIRSRLFKILTKNSGLFNYSTNRAIEFPDDIVRYQGRRPSLLMAAAMFGFPLKPRAGEPDFRNLKSYQAVVMPFATRNEKLEDKFSKPVADALGSRSLTVGVGTWDRITAAPHIDELNSTINTYLGWIGSIKIRLLLKKADYAKYLRVVRFLEQETGFSLAPYDKFPRWTFRTFIIQRWTYRQFFKATGAKVLFAVNAARIPFQAAAQQLGIKVVEIQSGVFSKYSLQFSWPGSPYVPYLPDEIWTWGDYWTDGIEHAKQQTVRVVGSTPEFESVRERKIPRIANQAVFVSQPLIGIDIFNEAVAFARLRPELNVVFKLHPRNDPAEFAEAMSALGTTAPTNLSLVHLERTSLELIAESEYAIGAFSTALIEAAGLGTRVGIIKLTGWEHLENLIDGGYASAFETGEQLAAALEQIPKPADPYFFYGRRSDIGQLAVELVNQLPARPTA